MCEREKLGLNEFCLCVSRYFVCGDVCICLCMRVDGYLVIREHDCEPPKLAVLLDVMHGERDRE